MGDEHKIEPVRVKELPAFMAAVEPLAREIAAGDVMGAIARNAEAVIEATAIGARVDREWLEDQTIDTLVSLASKVLEVNADFFVSSVLPEIERATQSLATISGGTILSQGSSGQDSPTEK